MFRLRLSLGRLQDASSNTTMIMNHTREQQARMRLNIKASSSTLLVLAGVPHVSLTAAELNMSPEEKDRYLGMLLISLNPYTVLQILSGMPTQNESMAVLYEQDNVKTLYMPDVHQPLVIRHLTN